MKNTLLLLATAALALCETSCKKEDKGNPVDTYSKASAKINGVDWNTAAGAKFEEDNNGRFSMEMNTYSSNDKLWMYGLAISHINPSLGVQPLHTGKSLNRSICGVFFADGVADAVYDYYDVLESDSASNQVFIDSYDVNSKIVTGRFSVSFYRTGNLSQPALYGFPDTLRITDGKFNAIIHEYQTQ